MANIAGYNAPSGLGLQPTEMGVDAAAGAARRLGAYGDQIADTKNQEGREAAGDINAAVGVALAYVDRRQISNGAAESANLWNSLTQRWEDTKKNADPNDSTVAKKFEAEVLEPALDQFQQGFTTEKSQQFAEQKAEALRQHFFQATTADMSTLAKIAVGKNINDQTTALSNTAFTDPSAVPTLLKGVDHSIDGILSASPTIGAVDQARVRAEVSEANKQTIVQAGAIGAIQKSANPEAAADEWIKNYPNYISGPMAASLMTHAKTVASAARTDSTRQVALQKQEQQDASDQREGQYIAKLHDDDPTVSGQVTAKAISTDFTLTREARERMINIVNREMKPETDARVSAQTSVQIMRQLLDPNADAQKIRQTILEARTKDPGTEGSITKADMADLQKQVDDIKTPEGAALASDRNEFFRQYGPTIDPEMKLSNPTPLGAQGIYRAEKDARRQEQALRARGVDPHSLYDPSSQNFLGKPERIGAYRPTLAELAAFAAQQKAREKAAAGSVNLTSNGSTVTGIQTLEIPPGMAPADAPKWAREQGAKSGDKLKLPDGRIGTVP